MIDLHAHILPFVDDGSNSLQASIKMVKDSIKQGVTDIILTPHDSDYFTATEEEINQSFQTLKDALDKENLQVNLFLGSEIFLDDYSKKKFESQTVKTLNDTKYVLIEFDLQYKCDIVEQVYEVKRLGYIPIVAHLERYYYANMEVAREVKGLGGLIQVNACSIVGKHRRAYAKIVEGMFEEDLVDFVASDIHSFRDNLMEKSYKVVKKRYGESVANAVYYENAKKIIEG